MGMMQRGEKPRDFKGTMRRLLKALSPYRWHFVVVFLFAIASTVFNIVGPKILGQATTKLFEGVMAQFSGASGGIDFAYIGNILILMVILYVLASVFSFIQGWIMASVSASGDLRLPQRDRGQDQSDAAALLRRHQPR